MALARADLLAERIAIEKPPSLTEDAEDAFLEWAVVSLSRIDASPGSTRRR